MPTTIKRTSISLTKEDVRQLNKLGKHFGEAQTQVIKRAILTLDHLTFGLLLSASAEKVPKN